MTTTERLPRTKNGNPKIRLTDEVYDYWLERAHLTTRELESAGETRERVEKNSLRYSGDTIFHYGHHFPLAEIVRDSRGRTRLILLNGDSYRGPGGWGPSTSARQREIRNRVETAGFETILLPFSTLGSANIDHESIRPIHIRPDRQTIHERSSTVRPARREKMCDPSGAMDTKTGWHWNAEAQKHVLGEYQEPRLVPNPKRTIPFSRGHAWSADGATLRDDGRWHWTERRHWLGDSIFRARITETRWRKPTAQEQADHAANIAWTRERERLQDTARNLRGDYFNAKDGRREWDHQERHYFLAEAPNAERALELRAEMEIAEKALDDHHKTPSPTSVVARNGRVAYTVRRWATFLSSFDYQESAPLYFMCELPYNAHPKTVEEAVECLKPPEVRAAEARGLPVIRQGDLFAIPTKLTKRQLRRMRGQRRDFTKRLRVLGTNHSVTEGIISVGGATLGRGIMRHEPDRWRRPDHSNQKLGDLKTWHLLVRNTVPRTR